MKVNQIPLIQIFRTLINNRGKGDTLSRQEIIQTAKECDCYFSEPFVDTTRRQLTVCGYLTYTGKPGLYVVTEHMPHDLTNNSLRKMYNEMVGEHVDTYISNSKTITDKYYPDKQ